MGFPSYSVFLNRTRSWLRPLSREGCFCQKHQKQKYGWSVPFITSGYLTAAGFASCTILMTVCTSSRQLSPFLFSYDTASKKLNVASVVFNSKWQFRRILQKKIVTNGHQGKKLKSVFTKNLFMKLKQIWGSTKPLVTSPPSWHSKKPILSGYETPFLIFLECLL